MTTTAESSIDRGTLIPHVPYLCGRHPIIAGTGVKMRRIALLHKCNTPQEIADNRGYLSLAHVYAALAYSYANMLPETCSLHL